MSEYILEDILDGDTCNIFSDPESEWTGTCKVEEPEDEQYPMDGIDLRPESDQPDQTSREYNFNNHKMPPMTCQGINT